MSATNDISLSEPHNNNRELQAYDFDYSFVDTTSLIAVYDNFRSAPRMISIPPAPTHEYIESLASLTYEQSKLAGGSIPYTVIREVAENFIHAQFSEIVISIFDQGNTIRFADQGPGIKSKDRAQKPGFTSAIEPMKKYIRGVGSGLPIVKDYLDFSNGTVTIEDNLEKGAIITIKLITEEEKQTKISSLIPPLNEREKITLSLFAQEGALGVTDVAKITDIPQSSTYVILSHLEEYGLIEKTVGQKRILTDMGFTVTNSFK